MENADVIAIIKLWISTENTPKNAEKRQPTENERYIKIEIKAT